MKLLLWVGWALVVVRPGPLASAPQKQIEDPLSFCTAMIEAFSYAESGRSRVVDDAKSNDPVGKAMQLMYVLKLADEDYLKAASLVAPYIKSKSETIQLAASAAYLSFSGLIEQNERNIALTSALLDGGKGKSRGQLAETSSDIMAEVDKSWKMLVTAAVATTYTMLEPDSTSDKMGMTITLAEKQGLMKRLADIFGDEVKGGPKAGQYPLEAAASTLYGFLKQEWKTREQLKNN